MVVTEKIKVSESERAGAGGVKGERGTVDKPVNILVALSSSSVESRRLRFVRTCLSDCLFVSLGFIPLRHSSLFTALMANQVANLRKARGKNKISRSTRGKHTPVSIEYNQ